MHGLRPCIESGNEGKGRATDLEFPVESRRYLYSHLMDGVTKTQMAIYTRLYISFLVELAVETRANILLLPLAQRRRKHIR